MVTGQAEGTRRAVENLLSGCAGARPGARLLILEEPPDLGYYAADLAPAVAGAARDLGFDVHRLDIGFAPQCRDLSDAVVAQMAAADHILYLARLGDQMRFCSLRHAEKSIVSYALTLSALSGAFGCVPHGAMLALKTAVNRGLAEAREIRITCPFGSDLRGRLPPSDAPMADVGIRRFPMCVFAPVPMRGFAGRVALARFLVGTGSIYYQPFLHAFDGVVMAQVQGNRITGYDGPPEVVAGLRAHVGGLAERYGLDGDFVHSWHAGIHPGCRYDGRAEDNPGRWSGSAFGNPRLLHIHTCGAYAPGEVCWNLLDPTVTLDGVPVWQDGRLHPDRIRGGAAVLDACPDLAACFAAPETAVGIV